MRRYLKNTALILVLLLLLMNSVALAQVDSGAARNAVSELLSGSVNYTNFALCDLDFDGNMEVIISDMAELGGWICDIYTLRGERLEYVTSTKLPLGESLMLKLKHDGTPCWFIYDEEAWQGYCITEIRALHFTPEDGCMENPLYKMEGQADAANPEYLYSYNGITISQMEYDDALEGFFQMESYQTVDMMDCWFIADWDKAWENYYQGFSQP